MTLSQISENDTILLTIEKGENLPAHDSNGLSDPYVVISVDKTHATFQTQVMKRTLNPHWNQTFTIDGSLCTDQVIFKIEVFDWNLIMKHMEIGHGTFVFDADLTKAGIEYSATVNLNTTGKIHTKYCWKKNGKLERSSAQQVVQVPQLLMTLLDFLYM